MKKKIWILIGISLAVVVIMLLILYLFKPASQRSKAIDAVSGTPFIILETSNFPVFVEKLNKQSLVYQEIDDVFNITMQNSLIDYLDSLCYYKSVKSVTSQGKVLFSFEKSGEKILQTAIAELPEETKDGKFIKQIEDELKKSGEIKSRDYKKSDIFEFSSKNYPKVFFAVKNHLLIISYSAVCIEKSIDNLINAESICKKDQEFYNIYESAGKKEQANVFVNMKILPEVLSKYLSNSYLQKSGFLNAYSGWTGLDMNIFADKINLNGFIYSNDSIGYYTNILKSQKPVEILTRQILTDNTAFYTVLAFNDYSEFDKRLNSYLKLIKSDVEREQAISDIKNKYGIDIKSSFYPLVENEICFSVINSVSAIEEPSYYTVIGLKSQSGGILELENILRSISVKTGKSINEFKTEIVIDAKTTIPCYVLPFKNLPSLLFGEMFKNCSGQYICFVKNFMVLSDSKESLHKFAYDAVLNKTLETNIEHSLFLDNFSDKSLMFTYYSFTEGQSLIYQYISDTLSSLLKAKSTSVRKIGILGYQITAANGSLYNNIVFSHSKELEDKPVTIWESRLDNTVSCKPALVINHNDNSKEILVQDEKNILYLLTDSGLEIWRIQLDEQITSKIVQIDAFKNDKLQYLFSTKSKLHLIDRLGNYIEKFPVSFRAESTAPIAVFDYDNNKTYRILVPCSDKQVYLYDAEGNLVKGWEFEETEHLVKCEPNHYVIGSEDYIVFNDKYRSYFISRAGNTKIEFLTKFEFSKNNKIWMDNFNDKARFVTTDSKGVIRMFFTDGSQDSIKIKDFSENHFFALKDIDSDGVSEYIFIDGKRLEVFRKNKKSVFSFDFESDITCEPTFYSFPRNQTKIGIVSKADRKIFLLNEDGSLYSGFPLHGLTLFSIGYLNNSANKFNLLVGGPENLLYNYEVNEN
ncbi:MAG TPA: DUF3352 domain-containing protein [Bacteroidales bacterium]|nr:DUF3352 domain-containing protein [Bacteroidales bacterium]